VHAFGATFIPGKARKAAKHQQHHAPPKPGARDPQRPSLLQKETPESKVGLMEA